MGFRMLAWDAVAPRTAVFFGGAPLACDAPPTHAHMPALKVMLGPPASDPELPELLLDDPVPDDDEDPDPPLDDPLDDPLDPPPELELLPLPLPPLDEQFPKTKRDARQPTIPRTVFLVVILCPAPC
jgi:hypothetical protein